MKVLITGDRNWDDYSLMEKVLRQLPQGTVIIEGEARGADLMSRSIGESLGFEIEPYPAQWDRVDEKTGKTYFFRGAGPERNTQMLVEGKPDIAIAFHKNLSSSKGTKDMVSQLKKAGVPTTLVDGTEPSPKVKWS